MAIAKPRSGLPTLLRGRPLPTSSLTPSSMARKRLLLAIMALTGIWLLEIAVSEGPLRQYSPSNWAAVTTDLIFAGTAILAIRVERSFPSRSHSAPIRSQSAATGRILTVMAIVVAGYVAATGISDYATQQTLGNHSVIGQFWPALNISGAALMLSTDQKLSKVDLILLVGNIAVATIPGGRTVAGLILLAAALKWIFFTSGARTARKRASAFACICVLILAFGVGGASRSTANGNNSFNPEILNSEGYNAHFAPFTYVEATMGIVGEAALVTHTEVPSRVRYAGAKLLGEDMFSFLPGHQETVNHVTIFPYEGLGSYVKSSRPGGTPNTLYLLGGNWLVGIGGFLYALILARLCHVSVQANRPPLARPAFLIVGSTFMLGAYGIGTPTATTTLALIVTGLAFGAWNFHASHAFHPKGHFHRQQSTGRADDVRVVRQS